MTAREQIAALERNAKDLRAVGANYAASVAERQIKSLRASLHPREPKP